jgi:putative hemolysin
LSVAESDLTRWNATEATVRLRAATDQLASRPHRLRAEVEALRPDARLAISGPLEAVCAHARQIPTLLEEIGRLREVTFRAVGEGTGRSIDLDEFDQDYLHLLVWNHERGEVVGAYRLGLTDEIVAARGVSGLYTSTLFRYDARLLVRLSPAIELGRSFIREEYQRSNALPLLWRGIAAFVSQSKKYRVLFGPVSISSRYRDASRQLLRSFLTQNFYARELGELVDPLTPPTQHAIPRGVDPRVIGDVQDLDKQIARLEDDGKGMPVLLRQYLRLNAKLLGFNVDPAFGHALDALMMVDLAHVSPAILTRYFGKTEAKDLLSRFAVTGSARAA